MLPSIPGIGASGGFTFVLEDRAGKDLGFLSQNVQKFMEAAARKRPELAGLNTTFLPTVPEISVDADRAKVRQENHELSDDLSDHAGIHGRSAGELFQPVCKAVASQGAGRRRETPTGSRLPDVHRQSAEGGRVPLNTIMRSGRRAGPEFTMRYNQYRAAQIDGGAAPGHSFDQATHALEEVFVQSMPAEMGFDYLGHVIPGEESVRGVSPALVFGLSGPFVFPIPATQYDSWSLPFSVLLGVPIAMFGAFATLLIRTWRTRVRENWTCHADWHGRQERDPDWWILRSGL